MMTTGDWLILAGAAVILTVLVIHWWLEELGGID